MDEDAHPVGAGLKPRRDGALPVGLTRHHQRVEVHRLLGDVDDVVSLDAVRGDIHLLTVDQEVAMHHELTGLAASSREPGAVHDIVETRLEDLQQRVTGLAGVTIRFLVVTTELLLEDAVGETSLLLLLELQRVLGVLGATATVDAGRVGAAFESLVVANQVGPEATGLLGHGAGVTSHFLFSPLLLGRSDAATLRRTAAVVRHGRDVGDGSDLEAHGAQRADRGLTARARALDEHVDALHAVLHGATASGLGCHLGGEGGRLAGALEADGAGGGPGDHCPIGISDRDDRVVEGALDVSLSGEDVLLLLAAHLGLGGLLAACCHQ